MPRPKLSVAEFWQELPPEHAFYGHPILHEYGEQLSEAALQEISKHVDFQNCFRISHDAFRSIEQMEDDHKPELTDLCREVVESVWGIPPDQLKGSIGPVDSDVDDMDFGEADDEKTLWELTPEELNEVQKRLLLNSIIQGAAIHAMMNNPRMVQGELNQIFGIEPRSSAEATDLYERFCWNALAMYWGMDYASMGGARNMANAAVGYERVQFENREGDEVPVVYAKGFNFAVALQEFTKGVAEVCCIQALADLDPDMQDTVVEMADRVEYEPYQIMVGPELWRRLLRKIGREEGPAEYLTRLSSMPPRELMEFVKTAIEE